MKCVLTEVHKPCLSKLYFYECKNSGLYNNEGHLYKLRKEFGEGYYWVYSYRNLFSISICDLRIHKDFHFHHVHSKFFSINYYDFIQIDEISHNRTLSSNNNYTYLSNDTPYHTRYYKNNRVLGIGIQVTPDFLVEKYDYSYPDAIALFNKMTSYCYPELSPLLMEIKDFRGMGIGAKIFYEARVYEALSIIFNKVHSQNPEYKGLTKEDLSNIILVTQYIDDHFTEQIRLKDLEHISYMGSTKLKKTFKQVHQCTITEYIQRKRINYGEQLLKVHSLTIKIIAKKCGYNNPTRFTELFYKYTGQLPSEVR
ncbi:helix-turn-helix domain-containing protein [Bacillus sp. Hm123]|uniref:helix-turn-helix domain-containing protein n=1 Tax=Bacillus sp. Hm123 TaxID=3450745 RepID=UPI003F43BC93